MFPNAPGGPIEVKALRHVPSGVDDFAVEILDQLAEGDKVVTYKAFSGVHNGDFMGIAPTGTAVRFTVIDIVRLRGGQFVERWGMGRPTGPAATARSDRVDALGAVRLWGDSGVTPSLPTRRPTAR